MLTSILVPIFVCVVLPVAVIWIVCYTLQQKSNNETQILLEAIKNNPSVDSEKLIKSFRKVKGARPPMENLSRKLLRGTIYTLMGIAFAFMGAFFPGEDFLLGSWFLCGMLSAVGIGFLITYFFAYKNLAKIEKDYYSSRENE
ncbi:MAG: hypothetical protein J1F43_06370 [Muribaculaceae bacterium]|nr:hypothetical protein [Muribaculaceae bacterium]